MRNNCQKLIETLQKPSLDMGRQTHLLVGFLLLGSPRRGSTKSPSGGLVGISLPAPPASLTDDLSHSVAPPFHPCLEHSNTTQYPPRNAHLLSILLSRFSAQQPPNSHRCHNQIQTPQPTQALWSSSGPSGLLPILQPSSTCGAHLISLRLWAPLLALPSGSCSTLPLIRACLTAETTCNTSSVPNTSEDTALHLCLFNTITCGTRGRWGAWMLEA